MPKRAYGSGSVTEAQPGLWRIRVSVGRDPTTGRPRQVERHIHGGRKAAETAMRELAGEIAAGKHRGTAGTVGHLLSVWPDHLERVGRAPGTVATHRSVINTHLVPALGDIKLRQLAPYDIDVYYQKQRDRLAVRTIRLHHDILSAALAQAVKWEWIARNPAEGASPPRTPKGRRTVPTVDQVRRLIDAAGPDTELAMAVVLCAITGGRRGEVVGLQWSDVDWRAGTVRIERQRLPAKGGDMTVPYTKSDGHDGGRTVSVGALGRAALGRYRQHVETRAREMGVHAGPWLLSRDLGWTPLVAASLGRAVTRLGKQTGIPVTPHAFRRFAATQMVGSGVDVVTAAGRLGHTPEVMLRIYAGWMPSRDVQAAAGLETLVLGKGDE